MDSEWGTGAPESGGILWTGKHDHLLATSEKDWQAFEGVLDIRLIDTTLVEPYDGFATIFQLELRRPA